jgi:Secretion system C-terminal sorting domain
MNCVKKNLFLFFLLSIFLLLNVDMKAQQSFVCSVDTNVIIDTVGSLMAFNIEITNTSNHSLTLIIARTENNLPPDWMSSLCYGVNCYSPDVDTIIADGDPLPAGDTVLCTLDVTALNNSGTGYVHLVIGDYNNLTDTVGFDFTASTVPITSVGNADSPIKYSLQQNYPNPFNPSTRIEFSLGKEEHVNLKVYDILGNLVTTLVDENRPAGDYKISLNASNLPSGVYIYRLQTKNYTQSRKMLLLK